MKINCKWIVLILPFLISGFIRAEGPSPSANSTSSKQFDDHFVDMQIAQIDKLIQNRDIMLKNRKAHEQVPSSKFQEERMEFTGKLLNEKKEFLTALKAMPQSSRAAAWKEFNMKQAAEKKNYTEAHKGEIEELQNQLLKQNILPADNIQQKNPQK